MEFSASRHGKQGVVFIFDDLSLLAIFSFLQGVGFQYFFPAGGGLVGFGIVFTAGFLSSWHILLRSYTFSSYFLLVSHVNGVSSPVLMVHLYTTGTGGRKCHTRDYIHFVVIHFMAYALFNFVYLRMLYVLMFIAWSSISLGLALVGWAGIGDGIGSFVAFFSLLFLFFLFFFPFLFNFLFSLSYILLIHMSETDRGCNGYMLGLDGACRLFDDGNVGQGGFGHIGGRGVWAWATVGLS